jgi:hypothetical protein
MHLDRKILHFINPKFYYQIQKIYPQSDGTRSHSPSYYCTFISVFILLYHLYLSVPCCLFHTEFLRKFLCDFIFFLIRVTYTISSFLIQLFNYPNNSVLVKCKIYASYTPTLLTLKFLCHFTKLLRSAQNNLNCNETSCCLF